MSESKTHNVGSATFYRNHWFIDKSRCQKPLNHSGNVLAGIVDAQTSCPRDRVIVVSLLKQRIQYSQPQSWRQQNQLLEAFVESSPFRRRRQVQHLLDGLWRLVRSRACLRCIPRWPFQLGIVRQVTSKCYRPMKCLSSLHLDLSSYKHHRVVFPYNWMNQWHLPRSLLFSVTESPTPMSFISKMPPGFSVLSRPLANLSGYGTSWNTSNM